MNKYNCPACNNVLEDRQINTCNFCGCKNPGKVDFATEDEFFQWKVEKINSSANYALKQIKSGDINGTASVSIATEVADVVVPAKKIKNTKKSRKGLKILGVILLIAAIIAVGLYVYLEYIYCPVKHYSIDEFNNLLLDDMGYDSKWVAYNTKSYKDSYGYDCEEIDLSKGDLVFGYTEFENYKEPYSVLKLRYFYSLWLYNLDSTEGNFKYEYNLDWGYVVADLYNETKDNYNDYDSYFYGGYYYNEDTLIVIYTYEDSNKARKDVDSIIDELGLPKPPKH